MPDDKLSAVTTAIREALKNAAGTLTKEEFITAFKAVLDAVNRLGDALNKKLDARLATLKDGKDGRDGTDGKDGQSVQGPHGVQGLPGAPGKDGESITGPRGTPGKDGSPDTPTEIMHKLNLEQVDLENLKSLPKNLDEIRNLPRGRTGMRRVPIMRSISLTSQVDGNTRSFTLPLDTVNVLGVWSTQFPMTFDPADWTLSGHTITLATPISTPQAGQTLVAIVETLFYA